MSGWPISKADLDPYAAETDSILNLPKDIPAPDIMPEAAGVLVPRLFRFSRPTTRFGEKYRSELAASAQIRVFVDANLVDLRLNASRRAVSEAVFRSYARPDVFRVKARTFALCLGGIENPRRC